MATNSSIEWTDATWITCTGCNEVGPECDACYAAVMARRLAGIATKAMNDGKNPGRKEHYRGTTDRGGWKGKINLVHEALGDPFDWGWNAKVFVNSMSDTFHGKVPEDFILRMATVMEKANWHTYQVLTKRAKRMRRLLETSLRGAADVDHVWWGVSVGNRAHGLPRLDELRKAPAKVRFLSVEPLLEDLGEVDLTGIHWVIVGGESGPRARPVREEWVQSILRQCERQGVAFFFKQWGGRNKKASGRTLNGRTYDGMPPISPRPVPPRQERQALKARYGSQPELIQLGMLGERSAS